MGRCSRCLWTASPWCERTGAEGPRAQGSLHPSPVPAKRRTHLWPPLHAPLPIRPVGEYLTTTVQDTERDNSSLFDRNVDNQKLAREDVEALKRAGKVRGAYNRRSRSLRGGQHGRAFDCQAHTLR